MPYIFEITKTHMTEIINNLNIMTTIDDIAQFIEFMEKSEKRALKSQLIRLMSHIIKWKSQPARRSASWRITIFSARREIDKIRADVPSLNQDYSNFN